MLAAARVALAEPPGAAMLARGIRALEKSDYEAAVTGFENALARGGLSRAQTLTAYVDLGAALVALGHTKEAQRAFEEAALIDPKFVVPPSSGRQATALANQARKKQAAVGPYHFDVGAPGEAKAGESFKVTVELDDAQAQLVSFVRVAAGGKFQTVEPAATRVDVEIPGEVAAAGAMIDVRFELLDTHENRLATLDKQIIVTGTPAAKPEPKPETKPEPDTEPEQGSAATPPATKPEKHEPKPPEGSEDENGDEEGSGAGDDTGPWSIPHGSKKYTATRTDKAPKIDGVLDDPIWQTAPKDDRFLSTKSKPYGKPTTQPTIVQVAYDAQYLYVAFRCHYSKPRTPSDAWAGDEQTMLDESEWVAVAVDALHGHTGGYQFAVSPAGVRADAEISDQGNAQNLDWHGIWNVDTQITADGWTAEFAIPWGSMYMPSSDDAFDIGIEFERHEPESGEVSVWTLEPPATEIYDVNFFGHVDGLQRVYPDQRLLLLPYAAVAFDSNPPKMQSQLTDLSGTNAQGRVYAGGYLRLHPPGPFSLDATVNPDFSAVNPDQALANFDRFELEYPEARAFFAEDNPRFAFGGTRYFYGDLGAQLFYSRRLGIITDKSGFTEIVPILWGVKSVVRDGGTEGAIMNVETVQPQNGVVLDDNATVARVSQTIEGQRFGVIALECGACAVDASGNPTAYQSGGADANIALYERHLQLSGFFAGTNTNGATSASGEGTVSWKSQDVFAKATLLDVGKDFQAPLGFFETTGVLSETVSAGYTPVVRSDHVQQVSLETQLSIVRDLDSGDLIYQRAALGGSLETIDGATVQVIVQPSTEVVTTPFPIGSAAANGITIPNGTYKMTQTQFDLNSPPNRPFVFAVRYLGGDLFGGTRNAPGGTIGVNLGRFSARASYMLYILKFDSLATPVHLYGHDVAFTAGYSYSPLARTTLVLEADTVAARATALVTTTVQFGKLSALTLSVRGASGSTFDTPAMNTFDNGNVSAILSLQLGASPF